MPKQHYQNLREYEQIAAEKNKQLEQSQQAAEQEQLNRARATQISGKEGTGSPSKKIVIVPNSSTGNPDDIEQALQASLQQSKPLDPRPDFFVNTFTMANSDVPFGFLDTFVDSNPPIDSQTFGNGDDKVEKLASGEVESKCHNSPKNLSGDDLVADGQSGSILMVGSAEDDKKYCYNRDDLIGIKKFWFTCAIFYTS